MSAPAELVIEVTADDIRLGITRDVCRCPIARAACRALIVAVPDDDSIGAQVTAHFSSIDLWTGEGDSGWATYPMPTEGAVFIRAFDNGGPDAVTPFTFTARLAGAS